MRFFALFFSFLMSTLTALPAYAGSLVEIGPVIVTAEKVEVQEKDTAKYVTVINRKELMASGATNLIDALKRSGGLAYKSLGVLGTSHGGMNSELLLRGVYGGELVLINGLPIQNASSKSYDLNMIPLNAIKQVEIVRGAASTLYGADAMTGIINIITRTRIKKKGADVKIEAGDFKYLNNSISCYGKNFIVNLGYQHIGGQAHLSDNFSKDYHYNTTDLNVYNFNAGVSLTDNLSLDYIFSHNNTGYIKINDKESGPDPLAISHQRQFKHFADIKYKGNRLLAKGFFFNDYMNYANRKWKYSRRKRAWRQARSVNMNKNWNWGGEINYDFSFKDLSIVTGADYIRRDADYNNQYGYKRRYDYSVFGYAKYTFSGHITASLGIREQFIDGKYGAEDYERLLPTLAIIYETNRELSFFANAGKAFKAPTFNNLYYLSTFLEGNPNLGPEKGWTYDVGLKWDSPLISIRLAGFYMNYNDKIEIDRSQGYPLHYYNAGSYRSTGIEWQTRLQPFSQVDSVVSNMSLSLCGYWADPKAEDISGRDYQAGPKIQLSTAVTYDDGTFYLDIRTYHLFKRERDLNDLSCLYLTGKYRVNPHLFLTFGVDNLFDDTLVTTGERRPEASNRYVYYDMPRMAKAGLEYRF